MQFSSTTAYSGLTQLYDFQTLTGYTKRYIQLLVVFLQGPKLLSISFLFFQYVILFEFNYRVYFDKYQLLTIRLVSTLLSPAKHAANRVLAGLLVLLPACFHGLVLYYYYTDTLEMIFVFLTSIAEYLMYTFLFVLMYVMKKTVFSGCTFISKDISEKHALLSRKLILWDIVFFIDAAFYLILIGNNLYQSVDLSKYITGTSIKSLFFYIAFVFNLLLIDIAPMMVFYDKTFFKIFENTDEEGIGVLLEQNPKYFQEKSSRGSDFNSGNVDEKKSSTMMTDHQKRQSSEKKKTEKSLLGPRTSIIDQIRFSDLVIEKVTHSKPER